MVSQGSGFNQSLENKIPQNLKDAKAPSLLR